MTVKKIEVERFSITSSKPFEAVVVALEAAVGKPDMLEFRKQPRPLETSVSWSVRFKPVWAGPG